MNAILTTDTPSVIIAHNQKNTIPNPIIMLYKSLNTPLFGRLLDGVFSVLNGKPAKGEVISNQLTVIKNFS